MAISSSLSPCEASPSRLISPFSGRQTALPRMHPHRRRALHFNSVTAASITQQDPYSTLGLTSGASEAQIKQARRKLALKFHPDVCRSNSCTAKFIKIEQAYETIMDCLHGNEDALGVQRQRDDVPEAMMGVYDETWEDWEEWMGWEGAGTRDYTSHINHDL